MRDYIYDLETYKNFFSAVIADVENRKIYSFEISDRKDQKEMLIQFLRTVKKNNGRMVGFNNIGFDYPILHFLLRNQGAGYEELYDKAQEIIETFNSDDKFKHLIPSWKMLIPQLDLFKIHHFDNKARATSLKVIEFNMRSDNIEDLPYNPHYDLTDSQKDEVLAYNKHDVLETHKFYEHSLDQIRFREKLTDQLGKDMMNHDDGKIGKDYFIMKLEESMPRCCYKKVGGKKKINQTKRSSIDLNDCILPYVQFERPEFQAVKDWLCRQSISETKGVFNDIKEHDLGELAHYAEMVQKNKKLKSEPSEKEVEQFKKENPSCWVEKRELKSGKEVWYLCWRIAENLNTVVDGFRYDFGTGGLHGAMENRILETTDEQLVKTYDVASYYPNLAISNTIYPEHLGEHFCEIYEDVYQQRKSYPKGTPENAMMKLALNSVYGDSNNQYSPFYDPKYTMTITVSGQLSLCMLTEMLLKVDTVQMAIVNTDGLEFLVHPDKEDEAHEVCQEWERITGLELEGDTYKKLCIANVNNYIGVT